MLFLESFLVIVLLSVVIFVYLRDRALISEMKLDLKGLQDNDMDLYVYKK